MKEAAHGGPADWTLVGLHPHNLTAVDAEAHVSAREDHCVLGGSVAHHAFSLALVSNVSSIVVDAVNIIQVHNLIVVKKLLLDEFEAQVLGAIFLECTVSELDVFAALTFVSCWINSLYRENNWEEVFFHSEKVLFAAALGSIGSLAILRDIDDAKVLRQGLLETRAKFVGNWLGHVGVRVEIQRDVRSISAFFSTDVHCNNAFVICVKFEIQSIFCVIVRRHFQLE